MNIAVIIGTRPEIIKMSPLMRSMDKRAIPYFILHTGQHYSYNLDRSFFDQLKLKEPKYNLEVGSGSHAEQTSRILVGVEKTLVADTPDVVLVLGDTNSVIGGALAARKLRLKVGHVEAGLRSYDWTMPEEVNRILTDDCSDYLFAPTIKSQNVLLHEGIAPSKILLSGNTIVDAVNEGVELLKDRTGNEYSLAPGTYFLVTLHRQENVDDKIRFESILHGLNDLQRIFDIPVIFPVHPRSRKKLQEFNLKTERITLFEPVDYLNFLQLEKNARLILTDSGGVQEEACILHVPCVTLRDNTEREETVEVGSNLLAGCDPKQIIKCAQILLNRANDWKNPFGDGKAGDKIIQWIQEHN